ncbi:MAG: cytochrome c family protein [Gammaproteobacteria bacterium]|nr:cytochrome c family protein [Gammaproteobacteria bacterium]
MAVILRAAGFGAGLLCGIVPGGLVLGGTGTPTSCDRARGERVFSKCAICHSRAPAVVSPAGPHLQGVVGRDSAALPQFKYSKALRELGQTWTPELLGRFLADPAGLVPGTTMVFTGLKDERDRTAVICLLAATQQGPPQSASSPQSAGQEARHTGDAAAAAR